MVSSVGSCWGIGERNEEDEGMVGDVRASKCKTIITSGDDNAWRSLCGRKVLNRLFVVHNLADGIIVASHVM